MTCTACRLGLAHLHTCHTHPEGLDLAMLHAALLQLLRAGGQLLRRALEVEGGQGQQGVWVPVAQAVSHVLVPELRGARLWQQRLAPVIQGLQSSLPSAAVVHGLMNTCIKLGSMHAADGISRICVTEGSSSDKRQRWIMAHHGSSIATRPRGLLSLLWPRLGCLQPITPSGHAAVPMQISQAARRLHPGDARPCSQAHVRTAKPQPCMCVPELAAAAAARARAAAASGQRRCPRPRHPHTARQAAEAPA